jgi:hypothetical protein
MSPSRTVSALVALALAACSAATGPSISETCQPASTCAGGGSLRICSTTGGGGACTSMRYVMEDGTSFACGSCADCAQAAQSAGQACSGAGTGSGGGSGAGGGGGGGGDGGTGPGGGGADASGGTPGGPQVLSFTSNVSTITPDQPATFIAVVTDPTGLDAIAGGTLMDDQGSTYAALGAGTQKSTYEATLAWTDVQAVRSIDFAAPAGHRTFVAKFFDQQGKTGTAKLDVTLGCTNPQGGGACGGVCADFTSANSCGMCTSACKAVVGCVTCGWTNTCHSDLSVGTCNGYCASIGKACANRCKDGGQGLLAGAVVSPSPGGPCTSPRDCSSALGKGPGTTYDCCCTE